MDKTLTIKKFQNGKLYNTETCQYMKLASVLELSISGAKIIVIDNKSKKDITLPTLALAKLKKEFPNFDVSK